MLVRDTPNIFLSALAWILVLSVVGLCLQGKIFQFLNALDFVGLSRAYLDMFVITSVAFLAPDPNNVFEFSSCSPLKKYAVEFWGLFTAAMGILHIGVLIAMLYSKIARK